ncbi:MAG: branched-chain amino acid ABC transporter permease [Atribacterota bacterium]|nr:branched-chain amino acid ABC transporter permease [Atribacterota bacterium]
MRLKHWLIVIVVIIVLPLLIQSPYHRYVLTMAGIFSILAIGLNFLMGLCGQISLAHAAFWGIGAYVSSLLVIRLNVPFPLAVLGAGIFGLIIGVLLGIPSLKLKGFYLAITTLGFGQIVNLVLNNWIPVTRGADGLPGIPAPSIGPWVFSSNLSKYYVIMVIFLIVLYMFEKIKNSRVGRAIQAIRDNELAAEAMGVNTRYYKVLSFALSSFVAALAGSALAHFVGYISPDNFLSQQSFTTICMLILGGSGTTWGPVIGASLLVVLPEWLRFLKNYYIAIYGLAVVIIAIKMPTGIVGLFKSKFSNFSRSSAKK